MVEWVSASCAVLAFDRSSIRYLSIRAEQEPLVYRILTLSRITAKRGAPKVIRVDNGRAFISKALDLRHDPLRRDRASRSKSKAAARSAATLTADQVAIPRTYKQAMSSPHAAQWQAAIDDHLRMHDKQKTWREILVPTSQRVLPCQWVFAIKTDTLNNVVKWKARTVLFGNLQQKGIDYNETFSPTVRPEQVRLLIAIAAQIQGTLPSSTQLSILS